MSMQYLIGYNFNTFLHPLLVAATSLQTENAPFCKENVLIAVGDLCIFLSDYSIGKPEMSPTSGPKFNDAVCFQQSSYLLQPHRIEIDHIIPKSLCQSISFHRFKHINTAKTASKIKNHAEVSSFWI